VEESDLDTICLKVLGCTFERATAHQITASFVELMQEAYDLAVDRVLADAHARADERIAAALSAGRRDDV
jgi:hypothetical protein